jgi:O-succinylbenzoic acid--CoA ligase
MPRLPAQPVAAAARRWPAAPALLAPPLTLTFAELAQAVAQRRQGLHDGGYRSPALVALGGPHDTEFVLALLAIIEAGHLVCPLSPRWPPELVRSYLSQFGDTPRLIAANLSGTSSASPAPRRALLRPATVLFTSGSSGVPKAAVHLLANHLASAAAASRQLGYGPGDRWLLTLPLNHVGGLAVLWRSLLAGGTIVLPPPDERALASLLARHAITHVSLVPTQLQRLVAEAPGALPHLRVILVGGAPTPPALVAAARAAGLPVCLTYGCTEMSSQICTALPGGTPDDLRPLPGQEVRIAANGEILVRGPTLFAGYRTGDRLETARDADGWYHTGDRGAWSPRGGLLVTGRLDRMFISGGENIQPEEIERALLALPGIAEAVVVPVPDAEFGQRPYAFVRRHDAAPPDDAALGAALAERLPRFKLPVSIVALPAAAEAGLKVDRQALTRLAREARP